MTGAVTGLSAPVSGPAQLRPLSEREFRLFQQLIHRESGIYLADGKQALVAGRLAPRLGALGLATYDEYYRRAVADPGGELVRALDAICTNETEFFREATHFRLLEGTLAEEWAADADAGRRQRLIRVWSAACSTGEEPYTLAMVLLRRFPPDSGWTVQVVASDLSAKALDRARSGIWSIRKAPAIPAAYREAFMLRGTGLQSGRMTTGPELRAAVTFRRINLARAPYPALGDFDAIFCRNVLIYFHPTARGEVVERLLQHLKPSGYLFLGHSEGLTGATSTLRSVIPSVYRRTPPPGGERGPALLAP